MADDKDDASRDETKTAATSSHDATGADKDERQAKDELFEAIDHFKNAASILFNRASNDPAVKTAKKEATRVVREVGSAAEPIARQVTEELGRLTRDLRSAVEGKKPSKQARGDSEEE